MDEAIAAQLQEIAEQTEARLREFIADQRIPIKEREKAQRTLDRWLGVKTSRKRRKTT